MRTLIACLIFSFAFSWARAGTHEPSIDAVFPDELAGLAFVGKQVFPQKELGVNIVYESGQLRGSVFIYNAGLRSIPDGADNERVRRHFEQVIGEVRQLAETGKIRSIAFNDAGPQTTAFGGCGPQFLWRGFEMALSEDLSMVSHTYLTAVKDHFVKLRVSYKKGSTHTKQDVDRFVSQLRGVIGKCPAP